MIIITFRAGDVISGMKIKHDGYILDVLGTSNYTDGTVGIYAGDREIKFESTDIVEVVEE